MSFSSVVSAPATFMGSATRHAVDTATFGLISDRYNARDAYRRDYDKPGERTGAAMGVAAGVALPTMAGVTWARKNFHVLQAPQGQGWKLAAAATTAAALGGMGYVGLQKAGEIIEDDGNYGMVGTGAGVVAGAALGRRLAGPVGGLAGLIGGGFLGHALGAKVAHGDGKGHIGEELHQDPSVDRDLGDRVRSFGRGFVNHMIEVGPFSQGSAGAVDWGLRDTYDTKYSGSERAGAMHGDLAAAGIMMTAAAGSGLALIGARNYLLKDPETGKVASNIRSASDRALAATRWGFVNKHIMPSAQQMAHSQHGGKAMLLGGAMLGAAVMGREFKAWSAQFDSTNAGIVAGGAAAAATGGLAVAFGKSRALQNMKAGNKWGAALLAAAGVVGVVSAGRTPLQMYVNDSKAAAKHNPDVDPKSKLLSAGTVGAAGTFAGAALGAKALSKAPKVGLAIGAVAGLAGGVAIGRSGVATTMPKFDVALAGTAIGTTAGLAGAALLRHRSTGVTRTIANALGTTSVPKVLTTLGRGQGAAQTLAPSAGLQRGVKLVAGAATGAAVGTTASAVMREE